MNIGIIFFLIFLCMGFIALISLYGIFTKDKIYFKLGYIAFTIFTIAFLSMSYKGIYNNYMQQQKYVSSLANPAYSTYTIRKYGVKIDYPNNLWDMSNKAQTDVRFVDKKTSGQEYSVNAYANDKHITLEQLCAKMLDNDKKSGSKTKRLYTTITGDKLNDHDFILYNEDKNTNLATYTCERVGKRYICVFSITYNLKYADDYKNIIKHTYDNFVTPDLDYSSKDK